MFSVIRTIAKSTTTFSRYTTIKAFSTNTEVPKFETLLVSIPTPKVYHVELNRPEKLNTFNNTMWIELQKCFSTLSDTPDCRVIILSGKGKHFTAGIDIQTLMELKQNGDNYSDIARKCHYTYGNIKLYQDGISSVEKCIKPVLCVLHSACVGAGVDLFTAVDVSYVYPSKTVVIEVSLNKLYQEGISSVEKCIKPVLCVLHSACVGAGVDLFTAVDVRYCTQDAWFQVKEVDVGLAADVGTLQRFPKIVANTSKARELCLTGRKFNAKEAEEIGLVSKVFPDKESALKEVQSTAAAIAAKSPVAVQNTKISLVYSQDRTNDEGLMHIRLINQAMLQTEDLVKAAMAQITKSKQQPEYEDF